MPQRATNDPASPADERAVARITGVHGTTIDAMGAFPSRHPGTDLPRPSRSAR
jgi:hypothetical protein